MSDFRKLLLAFAAVSVLSGIASAQVTPPITCNTTAQPLTVRTEGLTEQTGDVVLSCTGGAPTPAGQVVPAVNISVTLGTNITSRLLSGQLTEALLFIDDPGPATQNPCAPGEGSTVCRGLLSDGAGGAVGAGGPLTGPINVFQGVRQNDTTVVWLEVPINAPGSTFRVFRMKNIRAAIAGSSASNGQIFAFVSIQNPPANLQLNSSTAGVAFVQQGLTFALRSRTGGSFSATGGGVALFVCETFNTNLVAAPTGTYSGVTASPAGGRSFNVKYTEGFAASWKVRDVNSPLTEPGLQQNIPQNNNGADPTLSTVVESGFYNTGFPGVNGLNRAGRADHGTRLRVAFNNVPANVLIYVSAHALAGVATVSGTTQWSGSATGETTPAVAAYGVSTNAAGANIAAGTVLVNPLSNAELNLSRANCGAGERNCYPSGAIAGLVQVPIVSGAGAFTWEVFGQDPAVIDSASFAVALAYRSTANPGLGQMTVNGSFAPVASGTGSNTMQPAPTPIPRFADQSTAASAAQIIVCQTNLLFPFVSNQAGFDTGIAIANTSADPYGTSPQSGNCTLNYYGATTGGGAAPSAQTTTTPLQGGQTAVFTLSSGGSNGIAATAGFQGYIIVRCEFRLAHGFAFVSDVGAQRLSHGYLALILDAGGINRTGITGESLGQ